MGLRLKRLGDSSYATSDGAWKIVKDHSFSPMGSGYIDTEGEIARLMRREGRRLRARWMIYEKGDNEPVNIDGDWLFPTLADARTALARHLEPA